MEPYQANLRALTDDVKFKHEIIRFKIDKETGIVSDAHREELMPIVMRLIKIFQNFCKQNQKFDKF